MDTIVLINDTLNGFVWGPVTIAAILLVGLFFTIVLKGVQFRNWGFLIKNTYVKALSKEGRQSKEGDGEITSFQAAMASVSAVVGSGNIAGVATAIVCGGPGALFWMVVAACFGMATKFAEIGLGIKYRVKKEDGTWVGGPMYYISEGLHAPWLGHLVAIFIIFYSFVVSGMVDTNSMVNAAQEIIPAVPAWVLGAIIAVLTAIVVFGGITRIGEVCGLLSPFMAGAYLLCGILAIILNIGQVPGAIHDIIVYAFDPQAAFGGAAGVGVLTAARYGFARGIYSNEAGVGASAITHSSARVKTPGEQAIWGPLEVFVDTIVICSITGITICLSGLWDSGKDGVALTMSAFSHCLPGNWGHIVVFVVELLFGFSCLITYYNYVEKSAFSIFGMWSRYVVRVLWLASIMSGATMELSLVWDIADTINGIIIYPNIIALIVMYKQVIELKENYYNDHLPVYKEERALKKSRKQ